MKLSNFTKLFSIFILFSLILTNCKKGEIGPAGPQGEQGVLGEKGDKGDKGVPGDRGATGARGAAGARGATGAKGEKGTANVIYSNWINPNWDFADATHRQLRIPNLILSDELINRGTFLVYYKISTTGRTEIFTLPYTYRYNQTADSPFITIESKIMGNGVFININTYGAASIPANFTTAPSSQYRYVLIPGGTTSIASLRGVDLTKYEQVAKALLLTNDF